MRKNIGLYRGKRVDNGAWETGSLVIIRRELSDEQVYIADKMTGYLTPVIPETVGESTGEADRNNRTIFENDIVKVYARGYHTVCTVSWAEIVAHFQLWQVNTVPKTPTALNLGNYDCEVIGNIIDNPELLEVQ